MSDGEQPVLTSVGVAHTPDETADDAPHQGFADDAEATVEVFDRYADARARVRVLHPAGGTVGHP